MRAWGVFLLTFSGRVVAQPALTPSDLRLLEGSWTGELTYVNYTDGTQSTIPATLFFAPVDSSRWRIGFGYTEEPHANELDTVALAADGRVLDGCDITGVAHPAPDSLVVTLGTVGDDDDRPAYITKIWSVGPRRCTMRKEVSYSWTKAAACGIRVFRHEYRFRR